MTADQLKDGKPVLIAHDRLAVDQTGSNRELAHRHCDKGEPMRELVSVPGYQPHARTVPPRENTKAVMFDLVNPAGAGRRGFRR